jgi:hypothetical protein
VPRLERPREGFPTSALAVLRSPIAIWRELAPGHAKLIDFVVPRELCPPQGHLANRLASRGSLPSVVNDTRKTRTQPFALPTPPAERFL